MKVTVVTTVTSTYDIDTLEVDHSVDLSDRDGLSQVHGGVFGALIIGGLRSTEAEIRKQFHVPEAQAIPVAED